jgi:hypothetical protein
MSENGEPQVPPDNDRTPAQEDLPPPVKPADEWIMPQPVFRRSSGYSFKDRPQPVESTEPAPIPETDDGPPDEIAADDVEEPPAGVSEQPVVTEEVPDQPVEATSPQPRKKRGFFRVLLIIIGILAFLAAVAAVGMVVMFWYFFQVSESQNLN